MSEATRFTRTRRGTPGEVFAVFLKLGLTAFGGPVAHLGYFRDELVVRRRWLGEADYADLVALCQFLPGPASSQAGFALGLLRAGWLGAMAAFLAFTLPSALIMVAFASSAHAFGGPFGGGILAGLKIVAVAIVAQAVGGMARHLCPDRERASIALAAVVITIASPDWAGQIGAILAGALAGLVWCRAPVPGRGAPLRLAVSRPVAIAASAAFVLLLVALPLAVAAGHSPLAELFDAFYRAGALVFGGGHVVLPLLEAQSVPPGWIGRDAFLAGYGAAQAVPGPLFTFAAYLGATIAPAGGGLVGAGVALAAIFLPGFLLLIAVAPFWDGFRRRTGAQRLMSGANAAVVGLLGAALYDPVFTGSISGPPDFALALVCFVLLTAWKTPPWTVVALAALGGVLIGA